VREGNVPEPGAVATGMTEFDSIHPAYTFKIHKALFHAGTLPLFAKSSGQCRFIATALH